MTRPEELIGAAPRELLEAWQRHVAALVAARHGLADPALSVGRLRSHALDALAVGQALVDTIIASRWVSAVDALSHGAPVPEVAEAMGLDVDEVVMGLSSWADGQLAMHRQGRTGTLGMTPAQHAEVLALVAGGER